jgi:hypothetical protein
MTTPIIYIVSLFILFLGKLDIETTELTSVYLFFVLISVYLFAVLLHVFLRTCIIFPCLSKQI